MSVYGWIFMITAWGLILGIFIYCMCRTLLSGKKDDAPSLKG